MHILFWLSGGLGTTCWSPYASVLSRDSRESLTLQLAKKHEDNRGLGLIAWVPCSGRPGCMRGLVYLQGFVCLDDPGDPWGPRNLLGSGCHGRGDFVVVASATIGP